MLLKLNAQNFLPADGYAGTLVGRALFPGVYPGPCVVVIREDGVHNISGTVPTMAELLNSKEPIERAVKATGNCVYLGTVEELLANSTPETHDPLKPYFLSPIDLQAVKACDEDMSSHGVVSKAQTLSSIGSGAEAGIHPDAQRSHSEPEMVLIVDGTGELVGVTLGNDVSMLDRQGRAMETNASCVLGPFIRLFDDTFTAQDAAQQTVTMTVQGDDGFLLSESYEMGDLGRSLDELVGLAFNVHHQFPDGLALFAGTKYAPTQDRGGAGTGFSHKLGDVVTIKAPALGTLVNRISHSDQVNPWNFGFADLMHNLANRLLIGH